MEEKDFTIERQIVSSITDEFNRDVRVLEERADVTKEKIDNLESNVERLELVVDILDDKLNTMATKQDLREHMNYLEDNFKDMLTKSMYIVFALFFIAILFGYFF